MKIWFSFLLWLKEKSKGDIRHSVFEDIGGLIAGAVLISVGMAFLQKGGLLTSGIAGVVLLMHYVLGWDIGNVLFYINIPFYLISLRQLGKIFTCKTLLSVGLVSFISNNINRVYAVDVFNPLVAGLFGGILMGIGLLALFRHGASVGGTSILGVYFNSKFGIPVGYSLLFFDGLIFTAAFFLVGIDKMLLSLPGAIALNLMIIFNHKPGRYFSA